MSPSRRTAVLNRMHAAVKELNDQLGSSAGLPHESMKDLKSAVDEVRFRLWGVLMAVNQRDYGEFSERFRLRRAAEICRGIVADAAAGRLRLTHQEAAELGAAARELDRAIGAAHTQ